eukprot:g3468.t1
MLQVALTLGDGASRWTNSAPEPLRPSSATNRGPDRRGKVSGGAAMTLQRRQGGHLRRPGPGLRCETSERLLRKENGWPAPWADGSVAHDLVRRVAMRVASSTSTDMRRWQASKQMNVCHLLCAAF